MADNAKTQLKSYIAYLDYFVFVKNGYSVWKHLVPFAIAALLLIILSIPKDNLLLELADLLQEPSLLWLPAGLLTVISTIVYYYTINVQIRQAYLWKAYIWKDGDRRRTRMRLAISNVINRLWKDGDCRRTTGTSLAYVTLCTLMAYAILWSASSHKTTFGDMWASYLLAILSLTGIGWSGPNSWVESIGIKSPNYTDGRLAAAKLTYILRCVRNKSAGDPQDIKDFSIEAENLRSSIEKNLELEPAWTKKELKDACRELRKLLKQVEDNFPANNKPKVSDFAAACKCQKKHMYNEFIETLNTLGSYWSEWRCPSK